MLNKLLILSWIFIGAIIFFTNIISTCRWVLFFNNNISIWIIVIISIIVWIMIWFWIKWLLSKDDNLEEDDYNF